MKTTLIAAAMAASFTGCLEVKEIGKVNMISNRNVESKVEYVSIRNYMGGSNKELRKLKGKTIEEAIDNVVRNTPGGEFLKNVKIYSVNTKYFAVEGDVWGTIGEQNFKGFKVGDIVQWKEHGKTYKGQIVDLKDQEYATVKETDTEKLLKAKYKDMLKVQ